MAFTALIMAANRPAGPDPMAVTRKVSHKALMPFEGQTMLRRVVDIYLAAPEVDRILISMETSEAMRQDPVLAAYLDEGRINWVESGVNLFASVQKAAESLAVSDYPLLITTADNVLHTPSMVAHFCRQCDAGGAGVYVGLTRQATVAATYVDGDTMASYHHMADGSYSTCNLYAIMAPEHVKAAVAMQGGGQFRIKKRNVLKAFGLVNLVLYKSGKLSCAALMKRAGKALGVPLAHVDMPFADAPVDVDNERAFALATRMFRQEQPRQTAA
ncbi:MAG: nucleotidyltransferase family protein [Pseudomonadota bacterium]